MVVVCFEAKNRPLNWNLFNTEPILRQWKHSESLRKNYTAASFSLSVSLPPATEEPLLANSEPIIVTSGGGANCWLTRFAERSQGVEGLQRSRRRRLSACLREFCLTELLVSMTWWIIQQERIDIPTDAETLRTPTMTKLAGPATRTFCTPDNQ